MLVTRYVFAGALAGAVEVIHGSAQGSTPAPGGLAMEPPRDCSCLQPSSSVGGSMRKALGLALFALLPLPASPQECVEWDSQGLCISHQLQMEAVNVVGDPAEAPQDDAGDQDGAGTDPDGTAPSDFCSSHPASCSSQPDFLPSGVAGVHGELCTAGCEEIEASGDGLAGDECDPTSIYECMCAEIEQPAEEDDPQIFPEEAPPALDEGPGEVATVGDPVIASNGALSLHERDLAFPTPTGALELTRTYSSRSDGRGLLGSNWTHNFEVLVVPLSGGRTPRWAPPECAENADRCVLFFDGRGGTTLFFRPDDRDFYISNTSSGATLHRTNLGWLLRFPDGARWRFNEHGHLSEQRDRFDNGYRIEYEETALFTLYQRYCLSDGAFVLRDPRVCATLEYVFGGNPASWQTWGPFEDDRLYTKRCWDFTEPVGIDGYNWVDRRRYPITAELYQSQCLGDPSRCGWCFSGFRGVTLDCDPDLLAADELGGDVPPNESSYQEFIGFGKDFLNRPAWEIWIGWVEGILGIIPPWEPLRPFSISLRMKSRSEIDDAMCTELGWSPYEGFRPQPLPASLDAWVKVDEELRYHYATLPSESEYESFFESLPPAEREGMPAPDWGNLLEEARQELLSVLNHGSTDLRPSGRDHGTFSTPESPYGGRKLRPRRVVDDLGRELVFSYYDARDGEDRPAGLLRRVAGPAGLELSFTYARPLEHPRRLNEWFLVDVTRTDPSATNGDPIALPERAPGFSAGSTRGVRYTYDWNENAGSSVGIDAAAQTLWSGLLVKGKDGFASHETLKYIGSVRDNIIRVTRDPDGDEQRLVVASSYHTDPTAKGRFDRVSDQRFNSDQADRMRFEYQTGGWNQLPQQLFQRYPLEPVPAGTFRQRPAALGYFLDSDQQLAYTEAAYPFFEPPAPGALFRSALECSEIAAAEAQLPMLASTPGDGIWALRAFLARNANRICAWTRVDSREGVERWTAFNYKGQALVRAVREDELEGYLIEELLYGQEGLLTEVGHPVLRDPYYTRLSYEYAGLAELTAEAWRSRANLTTAYEYPRATDVQDHDANAGFFFTKGRLTGFEYEPAYQQLHRVVTGYIDDASTRRYDYELRYEFDTQCRTTFPPGVLPRACPGSDAVCKALERLKADAALLGDSTSELCAAGERCLRDRWTDLERLIRKLKTTLPAGPASAGLPTEEDLAAFRPPEGKLTRKRPSAFGREHQARHRARGESRNRLVEEARALERWIEDRLGDLRLPIQVPAVNPCDRKTPAALVASRYQRPETERRSVLTFANHGLLRVFREEGGRSIQVSFDERGFTSRLRASRFDADYGDVVPGPGCHSFGPYRWLLDAQCSLRQTDLLPQEIRALLELSPGDEEAYDVVEQEHNELGWLAAQVADGERAEFVRDVDGRVLLRRSPNGVSTRIYYRREGYPREVRVVGPAPDSRPLSRIVRTFDVEGRVSRECEELEVGGCDGLASAGSVAEPSEDPPRRLTFYEYSRDGHIASRRFAGGLVVEAEYNSRGQVSREIYRSLDDVREARFCYTLYGKLRGVTSGRDLPADECRATTEAQYAYGHHALPGCDAGTITDLEVAREHYGHDGLGRRMRVVDRRRLSHTLSYDTRDRISRVQDGVPACGPVALTELGYDDHGQVSTIRENDTFLTAVEHGPWGRSFRIQPTGEAASFGVTDHQGRLLWTREADGTDLLFDGSPLTRVRRMVTVHAGDDPRALAETATLSPDGGRVDYLRHGRAALSGITEAASDEREPLGWLVRATGADGVVLEYRNRNLLGWPKEVCRGASASMACSTLTYNHDGEVVRVRDSTGAETEASFNAFGELVAERNPGDAAPSTWRYDALGRVVESRDARGTALTYHYDTRGDLREIRHGDERITYQELDQLGRVVRQVETNHPLETTRRVAREFAYDPAGRLALEATIFLDDGVKPFEVRHHWQLLDGRWQLVMLYPSGTAVAYEFDEAGRVESVKTPAGTHALRWSGSRYLGRTIADTKESLAFDPLGRVASKSYTRASALLLRQSVTRDERGRVRTSFLESAGDGKGLARSYDYSANGFLERVATKVNATAGEALDLGSIADAQFATFARTAHGALESVSLAPEAAIQWSSGARVAHRPASLTLGGAPVQLSFEEDGGTGRIGDVTLAYDLKSRLGEIAAPSGRWAPVYLSTHELAGVFRDLAADRGEFLVRSGDAILSSHRAPLAPTPQPPASSWEAVWGPLPDQLLEVRTDDGAFLPLTDEVGSIVATVPVAGGAPHELVVRGPYGEKTVYEDLTAVLCDERSGSMSCPHDAFAPLAYRSSFGVAGLGQMRARWYSPTLRQFLTPDPAGFTSSNDPYLFLSGEPVNRVDLLGADDEVIPPPEQPTAGGAWRGFLESVDLILRGEVDPDPSWEGIKEYVSWWDLLPMGSPKVRIRSPRSGVGGLGKPRPFLSQLFPKKVRVTPETKARAPKDSILSRMIQRQERGLADLKKFREQVALFDPDSDDHTVAKLKIGDHEVYGMNSGAYRIQYPDQRPPSDLRVNAITVTHAEGDVFARASERGLTSRRASLWVDRELCRACGDFGGVTGQARQLGIEELTIYTPSGFEVLLLD